MLRSSTEQADLAQHVEPLTRLICDATASALARHPLSLDAALEQIAHAPGDDLEDTRRLALHGYQLVYTLLDSSAATISLSLLHSPQPVSRDEQNGNGDNTDTNAEAATTKSERVRFSVVFAHWVWLSLWCWAEAVCRASDGLLIFPRAEQLHRGARRRAADAGHVQSSPHQASSDEWGLDDGRSLPCPYLVPHCLDWSALVDSEDREGAKASTRVAMDATQQSAASWARVVRTTQAHWRATVAPHTTTRTDKSTESTKEETRTRAASHSRMAQLHALVTLCEHYRGMERFLSVALMRLDACLVQEQSSTLMHAWQNTQQHQQPQHRKHTAGVGATSRPTPPLHGSSSPRAFSPFHLRTAKALRTASLSRRLLSIVMGRLLSVNGATLVEPVLRWAVGQFMHRAHVMGAVGDDHDARHPEDVDLAEEGEAEDDLLLLPASAPTSPHRLHAATQPMFETATPENTVEDEATAVLHAAQVEKAEEAWREWRRRRYTVDVNLSRLARVWFVLEACHVRRATTTVRHGVCATCTRYGQQLSQLLLGELASVPSMPAEKLLMLWPLSAGDALAASTPVPTHGPTVVDASRALREAIRGYVRLRACLLFLMAGTSHLLEALTRLGRQCVLSGLSHFLDGFSSGDVFARFVGRWGVPLWRQLCESTFRAEQESMRGGQPTRHRASPQTSETRRRNSEHGKPGLGTEAEAGLDEPARHDDATPHMKEALEDRSSAAGSSARHTATGTLHSYGEARSQSTVNVDRQRQDWVRQQLAEPAPGQRHAQGGQGRSALVSPVGQGRGARERETSSLFWGEEGGSQLGSHAGSGPLAGDAPRPPPRPPALRPLDDEDDEEDDAMNRFALHEVATLPADGFPSLIYLLSRKEKLRRHTLGIFCDHVKRFFLLALTAEATQSDPPLASTVRDPKSGAERLVLTSSLLPPQTFRACVLALKTTMDSFDGLHHASPASSYHTKKTSSRDGLSTAGEQGARAVPAGDESTEVVAESRGMLNAADDAFGLGDGREDEDGNSSSTDGEASSLSSGASSSSSTRSSPNARGHRRRRDVVGGGATQAEDSEDTAVAGEEEANGGVDMTPWAALLDYYRHQHQPLLPERSIPSSSSRLGAPLQGAETDAHGNRLYSTADVAHMAVYKGLSLFFAEYAEQAANTLAQALSVRVEQHRKLMKREAETLLRGPRGGGQNSHRQDGDEESKTTKDGQGGIKRSRKEKLTDAKSRTSRIAKSSKTVTSASPGEAAAVHVPSTHDDGIDLLIALVSLLPSKEMFMARFLQRQAPHLLRLRRVPQLDYELALRRRLARQLGGSVVNPYTVLLRDLRASFQSPYLRIMENLERHGRRTNSQAARDRRGRARSAVDGAVLTAPTVVTLLPTMLHEGVPHTTSRAPTDAGSNTSGGRSFSGAAAGSAVVDTERGRGSGEDESEDLRRARVFLGMETENRPQPTAAHSSSLAAKRGGGVTQRRPPAASPTHPQPHLPRIALKERVPVPFLLHRVRFLCQSWWCDYTDLSLSGACVRRQHERDGWWSEAFVDAVLRFEWYVKGAGQGRAQRETAARLVTVWETRQGADAGGGGGAGAHAQTMPRRAGTMLFATSAGAASIASSSLTALDASGLIAASGDGSTSPHRSADTAPQPVSAASAHRRSPSSSNAAVEWVSASVASLPSRLLRVGTTGVWSSPAALATAASASPDERLSQRLVTYPGYGRYCVMTAVPEQIATGGAGNDNAASRTTDVVALATSAHAPPPPPAVAPSGLSRAAVVQGLSSVLSSAAQQRNQLYGSLRRTGGAVLGFDLSEDDEDEDADLIEAYGGLLSASPRSHASEQSGSAAASTTADHMHTSLHSVASYGSAELPSAAGGTFITPAARTTVAAESSSHAGYRERRSGHEDQDEDEAVSSMSYRAYSTGGLPSWSGIVGASIALPPASHRADRHVRWPLANGELTFLVHPVHRGARPPADTRVRDIAVTITGPPVVWLVLEALDRLHGEDGAGGDASAVVDGDNGDAVRQRRGGSFDWLQTNLPILVGRPLLASVLAQLVASGVVHREAGMVRTPIATGSASMRGGAGRRQYTYHVHDNFAHLSAHKVSVGLTDVLLAKPVVPWFSTSDLVELVATTTEQKGCRSHGASSCGSSSSRHGSASFGRSRGDKSHSASAVAASASHAAALMVGDADAPVSITMTAVDQRRVEAHIVACLKSKDDGVVSHHDLYAHVQDCLAQYAHAKEADVSMATLTRDAFKLAIASLIEKQFVVRDEKNRGYRYVP